MSLAAIFWAVYVVGYFVWFGYSIARFIPERSLRFRQRRNGSA